MVTGDQLHKKGVMVMDWKEKEKAVDDAMELFPETFGLRAFPGDTFKISRASSFWSDLEECPMLYTYIRKGDQWLCFAKGSPAELRREIVKDPNS
jgi:hypothetical protein